MMNRTAKQSASLLLLSLFVIVAGSDCRQAAKEQTAEHEKQLLHDTAVAEGNSEAVQPDVTV